MIQLIVAPAALKETAQNVLKWKEYQIGALDFKEGASTRINGIDLSRASYQNKVDGETLPAEDVNIFYNKRAYYLTVYAGTPGAPIDISAILASLSPKN